jgi:hypothetical protein
MLSGREVNTSSVTEVNEAKHTVLLVNRRQSKKDFTRLSSGSFVPVLANRADSHSHGSDQTTRTRPATYTLNMAG